MKYLIPFIVLVLLGCSSENAKLIKTQDLLYDAIIQLDESIQISIPNRTENAYSNYEDVTNELATTKSTFENENKIATLKFVISRMDVLIKNTIRLNQIIDQLKLILLDECKENTKLLAYSPKYIVWSSPYENHFSYNVMRLNLSAIKDKNNSDVVTSTMNKRNASGVSVSEILAKEIDKYSIAIMDNIGSYEWGNEKFSIEPRQIINLKNSISIQDNINRIIENSLLNRDDEILLKEICLIMTKMAGKDDNSKAPHWTSTNFVDESLVGTLAVLTAIQSDIIEIQKLSVAHWKMKYIFNAQRNNWK